MPEAPTALFSLLNPPSHPTNSPHPLTSPPSHPPTLPHPTTPYFTLLSQATRWYWHLPEVPTASFSLLNPANKLCSWTASSPLKVSPSLSFISSFLLSLDSFFPSFLSSAIIPFSLRHFHLMFSCYLLPIHLITLHAHVSSFPYHYPPSITHATYPLNPPYHPITLLPCYRITVSPRHPYRDIRRGCSTSEQSLRSTRP